MFPTAEVRWFLEGPIPAEARRWFRAVAGDPEVEVRTDRYVRPTSPDGLGVKWRSGKLEVKRRVEVVGEEQVHARVAGRVERWRKWSFPLAPPAELAQPAGDWIAVAKRRQVRYFAADPDRIRWVESGEIPAHLCGLELGAVRIGDAEWWSVCLEAFGPDEAALVERLRRVATHVVAGGEPPTLGAEHAQSYPAWLVHIGA